MSSNDTRYAVVYAFLAKQYLRAGNFFSSGDALYTYNVKLAYWGDDGHYHLTPELEKKYSVTSSAHQNVVREVLGERSMR